MSDRRGGRRAPLLLCLLSVLLAGVLLIRTTETTWSAPCDPSSVSCHLFGTTSPTFSPSTPSYTASALTLGAAFSSSQNVEIVAVRWYRASTTQSRPTKYTVWDTAGNRIAWGIGGQDYTDIYDDGLIGWQRTAITGSLRPYLTAGTQYRVSWLYPGTDTYTRQTGYTPVPDGPLSWVGTYYSGGDSYPNTSQSSYFGIDIEVRTRVGDGATATPTTAPTSTPTPAPTPTPVPSPTAAPTWPPYPTQIPYPTFPPYPTPVPMPTPVDYTQPLSDIRHEIGRIGWEIGHLPQRLVEGLWWALIPDQQWLQENISEVRTAYQTQFMVFAQVEAIGAQFQANVTEGACESGVGVGFITPYGTTTIPPPQFYTHWCPWRPVAGALIVLVGVMSAAVQWYRVLQPHE